MLSRIADDTGFSLHSVNPWAKLLSLESLCEHLLTKNSIQEVSFHVSPLVTCISPKKKDPFAFNSLSKAPIPEGLSISLLSHRGQWRWQRWADSWESVIWGVLSQRIPPFTGGKTSSSQLIRTSSCNDYETITKIFGKRSLNPSRY